MGESIGTIGIGKTGGRESLLAPLGNDEPRLKFVLYITSKKRKVSPTFRKKAAARISLLSGIRRSTSQTAEKAAGLHARAKQENLPCGTRAGFFSGGNTTHRYTALPDMRPSGKNGGSGWRTFIIGFFNRFFQLTGEKHWRRSQHAVSIWTR